MSDLLDLRQLKEGVFLLSEQVFDPSETLQMACDIFDAQTKVKGIDISWVVLMYLRLPKSHEMLKF